MKLVKIIAFIAVIFFLFVWGVSAYLSVDHLAKCDDMPSSKEGCKSADAIVAISGGDTPARTTEAIKLYKNGWANVLIFSGAAADKSGPSNARVMRDQAIEAGVPQSAIIIDEKSETTAENASSTAEIFTSNNIASAILVTSAYHERRAMLEFEARTDGVAMRSHPVAEDKQWSAWWWLTPIGWTLAMSETVHSLFLATGGVDKS